MKTLFRTTTIALLAAGSLLSARGAGAAGDHVHDSDELNYALRVPEAWQWEEKGAYEKYGAKEVAARRLETLANGKPAVGLGARCVLTVQDVPKELDAAYEGWLADYQVLQEDIKQKGEEVTP